MKSEVRLALLTWPVLIGCRSSDVAETFSNQPDFPGTTHVVGGEPIALSEAKQIAARFVSQNVPRFHEWADAGLSDGYDEYIDSSGHSVMYEFAVEMEGNPAGSVSVGATLGVGVIASFSEVGETYAETLRQTALHMFPKAKVDEGRLVAESPMIRALLIPDVEQPVAGALYDKEQMVAIVNPMMTDGDVDTEKWPHFLRETDASLLSEEAELRTIYTTASDEKFLAYLLDDPDEEDRSDAEDVSWVSGEVGSGSSEFSGWYQPKYQWTSGYCYAGCAPVAMGILLEYWDRHGYGSILSGNSHPTPDIAMLDLLREGMGTYCKPVPSYEGSTLRTNTDDGGDSYMDDVGYHWTFDQVGPDRWSRAQAEINNERPVLVHYIGWVIRDGARETGNHVGVGYYYSDIAGTASDFLCVKTGWQGTPNTPSAQCINPHSAAVGFTMITRAIP